MINKAPKLVLSLVAVAFCCSIGKGWCSGADEVSKTSNAAPAPLRSFKGWELYAWQQGGSWRFSLLEGTNRLKTRKEMTDSKVTVNGVPALKKRLAALAPGEYVSWRYIGAEKMTDAKIVKIARELATFSKQHKLVFQGP